LRVANRQLRCVQWLADWRDARISAGNSWQGHLAKGQPGCLDLLPADLATGRLNGVQPPMRWLVAMAADLGGRLVGQFVPGRGFARFDEVQVSAAAARTLAERVAAAWPATADTPAALPAATAEAWPSWAADAEPSWTGLGTDLLTVPLPPGSAVAGL